MAIVEDESHSVAPHGLELADLHLALAPDELFLARPVALHLGTRALDAEILGGQRQRLARIEGHLQFRAAFGEAAIFDEANSLFTIYRTADSLAPADRDRIHGLVLAYGDAVIGNELGRGPEDANGRAGRMAIRSLYDALPLVAIPEAPGQQVRWQSALNVLYSETIALDHARGERLLLARTGLPTGFWFVLYAGAAIAIAALVVIVPVSPRLHYAISLSAASLILLLLVLLRQLDQPYVGTQNIDEREFGDAITLLRNDAEAELAAEEPPAPMATATAMP